MTTLAGGGLPEPPPPSYADYLRSVAAQARSSPEDASPPPVKRRVTFGGLGPTSGQPSAPPSAQLSDPPERTEWRASGPTRARQVALAIDACESDALLAEEKVATNNESTRALILGYSLIALVISTTAAASLLRWNHQGLAIIAINALAIAMITSTLARHKQPRTTRTTAPPSPPLSPPPSPEERRQSVARIPTGPNLFSMTFRDAISAFATPAAFSFTAQPQGLRDLQGLRLHLANATREDPEEERARNRAKLRARNYLQELRLRLANQAATPAQPQAAAKRQRGHTHSPG